MFIFHYLHIIFGVAFAAAEKTYFDLSHSFWSSLADIVRVWLSFYHSCCHSLCVCLHDVFSRIGLVCDKCALPD